jgi:hypothetical protein
MIRLNYSPSSEWMHAFRRVRTERKFAYRAEYYHTGWGSDVKYYVQASPCPADRAGVERMLAEVTQQIKEAGRRVGVSETARVQREMAAQEAERKRKRDAIRTFDAATGTPWWRRLFG